MRILGFRLLIEAISYLRRLESINFGSRAGRSGAFDCSHHAKRIKQESVFILARSSGRFSLSISAKHNGFALLDSALSRHQAA
jgi:hypothetical protein